MDGLLCVFPAAKLRERTLFACLLVCRLCFLLIVQSGLSLLLPHRLRHPGLVCSSSGGGDGDGRFLLLLLFPITTLLSLALTKGANTANTSELVLIINANAVCCAVLNSRPI